MRIIAGLICDFIILFGIMCPAVSSATVMLDGLVYDIAFGGEGSAPSPHEIVQSFVGTKKRLATEPELVSLFDHFNLFSGNYDDFAFFANCIGATWGGVYDPDRVEFQGYREGAVHGIYQPQSGDSFYPSAFALGEYWDGCGGVYPDCGNVTTWIQQSDNGMRGWPGDEEMMTANGMGAWTVTPVAEPSSIILCVVGIVVMRRKINNYW